VRKQVFLWDMGLLFLQSAWAQNPAEYQKWLKNQEEEYQDFKDARDKEFVQFLSLEWKQMKAFTIHGPRCTIGSAASRWRHIRNGIHTRAISRPARPSSDRWFIQG